MSVCHLVFDEPQESWVCTACGKIAVGKVAIVQDSVDHHMSLYCEPCSADISPREVAGARTITNVASNQCPWSSGGECTNVNVKCHVCTRNDLYSDWSQPA